MYYAFYITYRLAPKKRERGYFDEDEVGKEKAPSDDANCQNNTACCKSKQFIEMFFL